MSEQPSLTARERAALAAMEDALRTEDPDLDRTLRGDSVPTPGSRRLAAWPTGRITALVVLCLFAMPIALAANLPALSLIAFLGAVGGWLPLFARLAPQVRQRVAEDTEQRRPSTSNDT